MGDIGQTPFRLRINITSLLYLIACLMSPAPLINLAESRVEIRHYNKKPAPRKGRFSAYCHAVNLPKSDKTAERSEWVQWLVATDSIAAVDTRLFFEPAFGDIRSAKQCSVADCIRKRVRGHRCAIALLLMQNSIGYRAHGRPGRPRATPRNYLPSAP